MIINACMYACYLTIDLLASESNYTFEIIIMGSKTVVI